MFIKKIIRYQRPIVLFLLPLLFVLIVKEPAQGRPDSDTVRASNVKWKLKDNVITINYDLIGSSEDKYAIDILLKKENDPSFSVIPKAAEGDIGEGLFTGTNREIRWYFRNDYPQGLSGEGYYFEVHVKVIGGGGGWVYYALGAAVIAGGAVALLVSKDNSTPPVPNTGLPSPPDRP